MNDSDLDSMIMKINKARDQLDKELEECINEKERKKVLMVHRKYDTLVKILYTLKKYEE